MCGICGYMGNEKISYEIIDRMNETMYHRGPDDSGSLVMNKEETYIGLAQRRLSIIDLSEKGHQPMASSDGSIVVVFNGEIYNYRELKKELAEYTFVTEGDTEIIIAGYLKWGESMFSHFNGMFAIALYDKNKNELILCRDRIGKKPLYYYKSDYVLFASELKPIMSFPRFEKKLNTGILGQYLFHGYIPSPNTIFENLYKVCPGHYIVISNGIFRDNIYWDATEIYNSCRNFLFTDYNEAKEQLRSMLDSSVAKRMIADVPIGTLLSGGIDSSLVTAIAQAQQSSKIRTYSIGFNDVTYDESIYAKNVADYLGTEHTNHVITEDDMLNMLDNYSRYVDEPLADPAALPTMLLSEIAKKNVTVTLSGDGGDELFCGYSKYEFVEKHKVYNVIGKLLNSVLINDINGDRQILNRFPIGVQEFVLNNNKETLSQFGGNYLISKIGQISKYQFNEVKFPIESIFCNSSPAERFMMVDLLTLLPDNMLAKVDRSSMRYSLENRCPLLDYKLIELSFRLPLKFKYRNCDLKAILKDIAYDLIPKRLFDHPKHGFSVPTDKWMRGVLKDRILELTSKDFIDKQGLFNSKIISELIQDYMNGNNTYNKLIWNIFILQNWYFYYMAGDNYVEKNN